MYVFSLGRLPPNIDVELREEKAVVSQMPSLDKTIPADDVVLPAVTDKSHLHYLQVGKRIRSCLTHLL